MDVITQALLGSAMSQTAARKEEMRAATFIGMGTGLLADTDVLIRSSEDTLLSIEYHRHFTHSVFFIPIGALIAALIAWPILKKLGSSLSFQRVYVFTLLGYCLSGFIDACTSYGTHLFWPLFDERISFHIIAIVDPLFTAALFIGVIMAYRAGVPNASRYALLFCGSYLLMGTMQMFRAEAVMAEEAIERGHEPERIIAKPTLGNLLLWRTVYVHDDRIHVDAVHTGFSTRLYAGDSVALFKPMIDAAMIPVDSVLYQDFLRFDRFSDGFVARHPDNEDIIGDIRYSMSPQGLRPLWGIDFDLDSPDEHAVFRMYHEYSKRDLGNFGRMLVGDDLRTQEQTGGGTGETS